MTLPWAMKRVCRGQIGKCSGGGCGAGVEGWDTFGFDGVPGLGVRSFVAAIVEEVATGSSVEVGFW